MENGGTSSSRPQVSIQDSISSFRPVKIFRSEGSPYITSLDFDDSGTYVIATSSDEALHIYDCKEGNHYKDCLSKKYGAHLGRFTHNTQDVLYASTKTDDAIRYLSTHSQSFHRYFKGHTKRVTGLSLSPQDDTFLSCSLDNTVRLWDLKQDKAAGSLNLKTPYFASFDPSATVIAIASPATSNVLLYDKRNYDKPPFATYDTRDYETSFHPRQVGRTWTGLEFSNDGKHVLVTTSAYGHFLLNAFDGNLEAFLARKTRSGRLAPGQEAPPGATASAHALGQGDACFTPDGRYVLSGGANEGVMVFDTQQQPDHEKRISPMTELPFKGKASTIAFNHQYHMFASADKELVMWLPDKSLMQQQLEDAR